MSLHPPDFKHYARIFSEANQKGIFTSRATSFTPMDLATIYNVPANYTGTGQKIAFIELGGGYRQSDLNNFFQGYGWSSVPTVQLVSILGATNNPTIANSDDMEVMLDLAVAIGVAKGITPIVYMAPNTTNGFIGAINRAVSDRVNIISISWGAPEAYWSSSDITRMNNAIQAAANANISVFVASGDSGASDGIRGLNVDFPGSCPWATSCGGTRLTTSGTTYISEATWNNMYGASGGGYSGRFVMPNFQANMGLAQNKRGVPDVAGDADPSTGIVVPVDGGVYIIGGTSAAAPMWAAITAVMNQALGRNLGFINPAIYAKFKLNGSNHAFHDVMSGGNSGYIAKSGWDACTGCGSPNVANLINALR